MLTQNKIFTKKFVCTQSYHVIAITLRYILRHRITLQHGGEKLSLLKVIASSSLGPLSQPEVIALSKFEPLSLLKVIALDS